MSLTAKQIYDLNNMNVASQNISLGTTISNMSGSITEFEISINELSGSLLTLGDTEEEYTQISGSLTSLDIEITQISGSLTSLDTEITQISGSVTSIENSISGSGTLNASVKNFNEDTASPGLSTAVYNSLAYRVAEIERHLHSGGRWFGVATTPSGEEHAGDRISENPGPFVIDAGNDDWGAWTLILGSEDTPTNPSMAYFDPHEIVVEDTENASEYFIQMTRGTSGSTGYEAGHYTEFVYNATSQKETGILRIQTGRSPAGSKIWARCLSKSDNTGMFYFYMGIHEYEG